MVIPCPLPHAMLAGGTLPSSPCHSGRWQSPAPSPTTHGPGGEALPPSPVPCRLGSEAHPLPLCITTWAWVVRPCPFPCVMWARQQGPIPFHYPMQAGGKAPPLLPHCTCQAVRPCSFPPCWESRILGGKTGQGPNPAARILKTLALAFYCLKRSDHFINL